jgi:hypothetical protein
MFLVKYSQKEILPIVSSELTKEIFEKHSAWLSLYSKYYKSMLNVEFCLKRKWLLAL